MYKVVIIDNERNELKKIIDAKHCHCEVVALESDMAKGIAGIRQYRPDILFMDMDAPGADGANILSRLQSEFPDMQITALAKEQEPERTKLIRREGVTDVLLKPYNPYEVGAVMSKMIQKKQRQGEAGKNDGTNEKEFQDQNKSGSGSFIVHNALNYMHAHYAEKLSLTDLADKIYVSQWYLSKQLHKYTGKSFNDLLNEIRIEKAKALMDDPVLKIHEISEIVGFCDVAHFSRVFKKAENISPKKYRNERY